MVYDVLYKTLIGYKPLTLTFDKIDGFIRDYDGTRYLTLFSSEKYEGIYNKIIYFIGVESGVTNGIKYSRLDQVKFVEDSFWKIWMEMVYSCRPYLNTLSQMFFYPNYTNIKLWFLWFFTSRKNIGFAWCYKIHEVSL